MVPNPRTPEQRLQDTLRRLDHDVDAWVATADDATPNLAPHSFLWNGATLLIAARSSSLTGRNLLRTGRVRLGIGPTRDLVLVEGTVETQPAAQIAQDVGDAFAAKTEFDPRELDRYHYFSIRPRRIEAWREENELQGRYLMRDGRWLVPSAT